MFGIYRGRRLALYIALAINLITNYFRLINMRANGRQ